MWNRLQFVIDKQLRRHHDETYLANSEEKQRWMQNKFRKFIQHPYRTSKESHILCSNRMNTNSFVRDTTVDNKHKRQPREIKSMRDIWKPSKKNEKDKRIPLITPIHLKSLKNGKTNSIVVWSWCLRIRIFVKIFVFWKDTKHSFIWYALSK